MKLALFLVAFAILSTGCVTPQGTAKTRAANDFTCAPDLVHVTSIGGNSYKAEGCGKSAVYDCGASDAYKGSATNYTCVPEGAPATAGTPDGAAK